MVLPTLFSQLHSEGVTRGGVASALSISRAELEALVFDLVMNPIAGGRAGDRPPTQGPGPIRVK